MVRLVGTRCLSSVFGCVVMCVVLLAGGYLCLEGCSVGWFAVWWFWMFGYCCVLGIVGLIVSIVVLIASVGRLLVMGYCSLLCCFSGLVYLFLVVLWWV